MGAIFSRRVLYQKITQEVINLLKQGKIVWKEEWDSVPMNGFSKKAYNGINKFMLWLSSLKNNYNSNLWFTFQQIKKLQGKIKKGAKAEYVYFYSVYTPNSMKKLCRNCKNLEQCEEGKSWINSEKDLEFNPEKYNEICENYKPIYKNFLKCYPVFNKDCIEKINVKEPEKIASYEGIKNILKFYSDKPYILEKGDKAYYDISEDIIIIPKKNRFFNEESYYATLFHELIHSTGNEKRLNRKTLYERNLHNYSLEELIAELGACFLCAEAGISNSKRIKNSSAYIKSWIEILENNPDWIWKASIEAEKACQYIFSEQSFQEQKVA